MRSPWPLMRGNRSTVNITVLSIPGLLESQQVRPTAGRSEEGSGEAHKTAVDVPFHTLGNVAVQQVLGDDPGCSAHWVDHKFAPGHDPIIRARRDGSLAIFVGQSNVADHGFAVRPNLELRPPQRGPRRSYQAAVPVAGCSPAQIPSLGVVLKFDALVNSSVKGMPDVLDLERIMIVPSVQACNGAEVVLDKRPMEFRSRVGIK